MVISSEDELTSHLSVHKKHDQRPSKPRVSDNHLIKDRKLFAELNEEIEEVVGCANKTESRLCRRGLVVFCVTDSEGNARRVELRDALNVKAYVRNLLSVSRLKKFGVEIRFGEENSLTTSDETKFQIEQEKKSFPFESSPRSESNQA